jgi:uncharacterized protein (DUF1800 family)
MKRLQGPLAVVLSCILCAPVSPGYAQQTTQDTTQKRASTGAEYKTQQLQGDQRIIHALNRFTFGPRPGDVEAVRSTGLEKWFDQQLHPASIDASDLNSRLAQFPAMRWTTAQLLYYLPGNAMIRQAGNGRANIPADPVIHAIYENQIARMQERKENKANKGLAAQPQTDAATSDAATAGAAASPPPAMSPTQEMADNAAAMAPAQNANNMSANGSARAQSQFSQAEIGNILALEPQQRVFRLAGMQPDDFESFIKSLRPMQRQALVANMNPGQKQTIAALENPERLVAEELIATRLTRDIYSNAQLQEVMTDFWLNHFNVYLRKNPQMPYLLVSYERDTVRPRALGKFEDLLEAVAHSPAMLLYLDNAQSIGPDSLAAQRAEQARARAIDPQKKKVREGLNENYARELMELHTVGVNGGYTQADVVQAARILTGWTVDRPLYDAAFTFNANRHEPGKKKVMNQKFKDNGEKEGRELLHMLATRPATAQFISRKLAIRFVSDEPPQTLVDRMAKSYLASDGDISAVLKTLFHSPEFWSTSTYRAKVKTPLEFVVSAVRASGATFDNLRPIENNLRQMGMPTYGAIPPTGYKWDAADWVSTGALVDRMNFALNLAGARLPGVTVGWAPIPDLNAEPAESNAIATTPTPETEESRLESLLIPGGVSDTTRTAALQQFAAQSTQNSVTPISAAMRPDRAPNALEREDQILAGLLIGSPEFQRR